jgi:hypothetical protein
MLVAGVVIDALLRFAPVGWRPLAPGEGAVRHRVPGEAYARNLSNKFSVGYGDLAWMGNLRELREYRSSSFTTDEHGFRASRWAPAAAAVVFGDSFAVAGRDGETLADQLGRVIGCGVYNAAAPEDRFQKPEITLVTAVTTRTRLRNGYVIMERVERLFPKRASRPESSSIGALVKVGFAWAAEHVRGFTRMDRILTNLREMAGSSPLVNISEGVFRLLKDDRILPNSYQENVVRATLRNGDWMLFYPDELATYEKEWPVDISYWARTASELNEIGLTLIVVLVPNKYAVYHGLLAEPLPVAVTPGKLLQRVEAELRTVGIIVVNLTNVLGLAAARGLDLHQYVYWRDDTHWNEQGISIAAAEIYRAVPGLREACAPGGKR